MRLAPKLVILMVAVAGVPLGLAGASAIRLSRQVTREQVHEAHLRLALNLADSVRDFVASAGRSLSIVGGSFDWDLFGPQRRAGALSLLFYQFPSTDALELREADGTLVAGPIAASAEQVTSQSLAERAPRDPPSLRPFHEHLAAVMRKALETGKPAASPLYDPKGVRGPHTAVAVRVGTGKVLAAEISLEEVRGAITQFHIGKQGEAFVVDQSGTVVVHKDAGRQGLDLSREPFIQARLADPTPGAAAGELSYGTDERWIAAWAPVELGKVRWGVVVAQPEREAFVASRTLAGQTLLWTAVALVFACVLAVFYAREVGRPVEAAAEGSRKLAAGDLSHRIKVTTSDEIGELARAFNGMAAKLEASMAEISRQNEEIKGWNATLLQKVEERTRALREAQAQIVQTKKLAALAELGAGVAHELNNPLAGIKGFAQILMMSRTPEDKDFKALKSIEEGARRCSDIVSRMLRFSQEAAGTGREKIDLNKVVKDSLAIMEQRLLESSVTLKLELATALPEILGSTGELREVCWHVLSNARNAMPGGGTLTIKTWSEETPTGVEVKVAFGDSGKGIEPEIQDRIFEPFFTTKNEWRGTGLGLAVVHRIVTDHGGTIRVDSTPGKGATFTLSFPGGAEGGVATERAVEENTPSRGRPKTRLV